MSLFRLKQDSRLNFFVCNGGYSQRIGVTIFELFERDTKQC